MLRHTSDSGVWIESLSILVQYATLLHPTAGLPNTVGRNSKAYCANTG